MDDSRTRIVIYYSIWATICAAVAGVLIALIHTAFFSYHPGRSAFMETLLGGIVTAGAIAAGGGGGRHRGGGGCRRARDRGPARADGPDTPTHSLTRPADRCIRFRDVLPADGGPRNRIRLDSRSCHSCGRDGCDHSGRLAQPRSRDDMNEDRFEQLERRIAVLEKLVRQLLTA